VGVLPLSVLGVMASGAAESLPGLDPDRRRPGHGKLARRGWLHRGRRQRGRDRAGAGRGRQRGDALREIQGAMREVESGNSTPAAGS